MVGGSTLSPTIGSDGHIFLPVKHTCRPQAEIFVDHYTGSFYAGFPVDTGYRWHGRSIVFGVHSQNTSDTSCLSRVQQREYLELLG